MKKIFLFLSIVTLTLPILADAATKTKPYVPVCLNITRDLKLGSKDLSKTKDVSALQRFLRARGFYAGAIAGGYGSATKKAVQKFQERYGLYVKGKTSSRVAGVVEKTTRGKIKQLTCSGSILGAYTQDLTLTYPNGGEFIGFSAEKIIDWQYPLALSGRDVRVTITLSDVNAGLSYTLVNNQKAKVGLDGAGSNIFLGYGKYVWASGKPAGLALGNNFSVIIKVVDTKTGEIFTDSSDGAFRFFTSGGGSISSGGGGGGGGGGGPSGPSCSDLWWFDVLATAPVCAQKNFCGTPDITTYPTIESCQAALDNFNKKATGNIEVKSPVEGASFSLNTTIPITWTDTTNIPQNYWLQFFKAGDSSPKRVVEVSYGGSGGTVSSQTYNYNFNYNSSAAALLPASPSGVKDYKIKVCQAGRVPCDDSGFFSLSVGDNVSSITVTSPNGGESYLVGSSITVTWTHSPSISKYSVYLLKDGVETDPTPIVSTLAGASSASLPLPHTESAGAHYKVKVCRFGNTSDCDSSDNVFSITPAVPPDAGSLGPIVKPVQNSNILISSQDPVWVEWSDSNDARGQYDLLLVPVNPPLSSSNPQIPLYSGIIPTKDTNANNRIFPSWVPANTIANISAGTYRLKVCPHQSSPCVQGEIFNILSGTAMGVINIVSPSARTFSVGDQVGFSWTDTLPGSAGKDYNIFLVNVDNGLGQKFLGQGSLEPAPGNIYFSWTIPQVVDGKTMSGPGYYFKVCDANPPASGRACGSTINNKFSIDK